MRSTDVLARLKAAGWRVVRVRGSHHQLKHPDRAEVITVPHPRKVLGVGLAKRILKMAGLE